MNSQAMLSSAATNIRVGDLDYEDYHHLAACEISAWDIETTGLDYRLAHVGTVQIADDAGRTWIVKVDRANRPELVCSLLSSSDVRKLFHFAPFDLGFMRYHWGVRAQNVACTKVLDRLVEPKAPSHSLKEILRRELGIDLPKDERVRRSDWSTWHLSQAQVDYAVSDVVFLVPLYEALIERAARQGVSRIAERTFEYLPVRVETELLGLEDVFAYNP